MGVIRWESPDGARRTAWEEKWRPVADELQHHPREWAVIEESTFSVTTGLVANIKNGRSPFGPKGAFEAASRTVMVEEKKVFRAYARYVGEVKP